MLPMSRCLMVSNVLRSSSATRLTVPGGYTKFVAEGWNDDWFPVWLQDAGYNMYYSGKLFNGHTVNNYNAPYPKGFAGTVSFLFVFVRDWRMARLEEGRIIPPQPFSSQLHALMIRKAFLLGPVHISVLRSNHSARSIATCGV